MIKTSVSVEVGYTEDSIKDALIKILPVEKGEIGEIQILKEELSVDTGVGIGYKLTLGVGFSEDREAGLLKMKKKVSPCPTYTLELPRAKKKGSPVIVGSGPAGLFAALVLSEAGCNPTVLERGLDVDGRIKKVNEFILTGKLDTECNIQFGEGGAGTYSDGKLKVGSMDAYKHYVLSAFVEAGAPPEILYSSSAHLGTDKLSGIVKKLRERMISLGATFIYGARMTDFRTKDGRVCAVEYEKGGKRELLDADSLILAAGHSARDVFELLASKGIPMQAKGFGVGVRVEHPREYVDGLVYGKHRASAPGAASYHLVSHLQNGRSVYSFCMCPGGSVVAATSSQGGVVTNGMSEYGRDAANSNAAILVSVTPADFASDSALAGIEYQKKLEEGVFSLLGEYRAPASRLCDLYSDKAGSFDSVKPSYPRGVGAVHPDAYLPDYITESLKAGFLEFDKWMPGYFLGDAVLTGAETRSTSPVRVLRTDSFEAFGVGGLYPVGEGAGYAGGIVSSARDGAMVAISLVKACFL